MFWGTHIRRSFVAALVAAALLSAAGCGDDDEASGGSDASESEELRDASDVNQENAEAASTQLEYGEAGEYEDVSVTIRSAHWEEEFESGDSDFRTIIMDVLFENRSDEDVDSPLITVHCENHPDDYSNQHSGPIDPFDPLPSGTKAEGPTETGVTMPCENGWIQWSPMVIGEEVPTFRWPLPAQ